jgi:hypothetical protein
MMRISLDIPDELAPMVTAAGKDLSRTALEALGLEAYSKRRITGFQLRQLLGLHSRWELEEFLRAHRVYDYSVEDFEKDWATIRELRGHRTR